MTEIYFPPPGESMDNQSRQTPDEAGLKPEIIHMLNEKTGKGRWALWRAGYLIHVQGDFNEKTEVKSLRKTWHALTVGAAIKQGKIPSYNQEISVWTPELTDKNADATWWHVVTQSSGFDYPYGEYEAYKPGEMWTYSDKNPKNLCNALARVYGKRDYYDNYDDVVRKAYFDKIGMQGWSTSTRRDGIRFHFDLEDMGRLGLLMIARGRWNGEAVIPQWFVEELETKQTYGMFVNYDGPDDGKVGLDPKLFPEAPYGFMTWVNTDGDYYPGADKNWAWGAGAGGTYILWNHRNGIVFAGVGIDTGPSSNGIPHVIEKSMTKLEEAIWPGREWSGATPEAIGMSSSKLDSYISWLSSKAGGEPFGTIVIRNGKIALEYYGDGADASSTWEIGSIRKAVGSALLGIAIEEGRLSLETRAHDVWPEILQTEKDKEIRVKHLFESTSGWKRPEAPGTKWVYNNAAFTAGGIVLGRIYQLPEDRIAPLAKRQIADRIGASSWHCYHYPGDFSASDGNPGPKLAVDSNMRDLARFGYLWLRKGRWNGAQIIPEAYVTEATQNQVAHLNRHYGFCWFVNDGRILLPDAPEGAYFHVGNGKDDRRTVIMVIPSLDLVAAVGVHAARYNITSGYKTEPVENVNEWIGKIIKAGDLNGQ